MTLWVDSHVNLHSEKFAEDVDAVLSRAREAGVAAMLTICDRLDRFDEARAFADAGSAIWCTAGIHPHHAKDFAELTPETLIRMAEDPRVVGIGECGLDRYYEYSPFEVQRAVFRAHVEAAQHTGLPLVIHARDADTEVAEELEAAAARGPITPLLHCYTGGPDLLRMALDLGGYAAYSGILTFKNATAVREVAKATPLARTLIETDCPYLAPTPHRGRRNEPSYLPDVGAGLAAVHDAPVETIAAATADSFFRLFQRCDRGEIQS